MNKIVSVHPIFPPRKMFLLVVFIYYVCYRILSSAFLFKAQCLNKETSNHTTPAGIPFQRTSHMQTACQGDGQIYLVKSTLLLHCGRRCRSYLLSQPQYVDTGPTNPSVCVCVCVCLCQFMAVDVVYIHTFLHVRIIRCWSYGGLRKASLKNHTELMNHRNGNKANPPAKTSKTC